MEIAEHTGRMLARHTTDLRRAFRVAPALAATIGLVLAVGPRALAATEASCVSCHAKLTKAKNAHPAAEDCATCHEPVGGAPHPQKGKKTFKLTQEQPALCLSCHEAFDKPVVHAPAKEGSCTTCHDPHGSDEPKLLVAAPKELCASCHAEKSAANHLHGPVAAGDCTTCHAPHESERKGLLVKEGDALCATCHAEASAFAKTSHRHAALDAGCTTCHDPHGAATPQLLQKAGSELCLQCHDDVGAKVAASAVAHAPLAKGKGCVACHAPHGSDNAKLLIQAEKETCLGCHKDLLPKNVAALHAPIKAGRCSACHDPHGSASAKLLVKDFPRDAYVKYTDKSFALCFECHDRNLLQYPDTSFATSFRDGEKNLHYVHVNNPAKGRSCALCHEVHASAGPRLVADSVRFGQWKLPLKYVKTATGGSCSPGCHQPYSYDRNSPGHKLELPRAERSAP